MLCLLPISPTVLVQLRWAQVPEILHVSHLTTIIQPIGIFVCRGSAVCVKNYPPEIMQPSSSTRATIVSAANQNGATIVKATFFFCHYYIVWESNNAGEAQGQSWHESLKSRWIPGGLCCHTSGTKRKQFAALSSLRPCWRWLQLQPSCGFPQWGGTLLEDGWEKCCLPGRWQCASLYSDWVNMAANTGAEVVEYGKPFGFLFSISRYRELFPDIWNSNSRYREFEFPISGNNQFPDIGKWFSDIGNWFSDIGKCVWFPDIWKSIPDIRKSPPDRSSSLRHPATPPYHTALYQ